MGGFGSLQPQVVHSALGRLARSAGPAWAGPWARRQFRSPTALLNRKEAQGSLA